MSTSSPVFVDANALLNLARPAKHYSPEMLVIGKGHVFSAIDTTPFPNLEGENLRLRSVIVRVLRFIQDVPPTRGFADNEAYFVALGEVLVTLERIIEEEGVKL